MPVGGDKRSLLGGGIHYVEKGKACSSASRDPACEPNCRLCTVMWTYNVTLVPLLSYHTIKPKATADQHQDVSQSKDCQFQEELSALLILTCPILTAIQSLSPRSSRSAPQRRRHQVLKAIICEATPAPSSANRSPRNRSPPSSEALGESRRAIGTTVIVRGR